MKWQAGSYGAEGGAHAIFTKSYDTDSSLTWSVQMGLFAYQSHSCTSMKTRSGMSGAKKNHSRSKIGANDATLRDARRCKLKREHLLETPLNCHVARLDLKSMSFSLASMSENLIQSGDSRDSTAVGDEEEELRRGSWRERTPERMGSN